jgi:hypothetical protein
MYRVSAGVLHVLSYLMEDSIHQWVETGAGLCAVLWSHSSEGDMSLPSEGARDRFLGTMFDEDFVAPPCMA